MSRTSIGSAAALAATALIAAMAARAGAAPLPDCRCTTAPWSVPASGAVGVPTDGRIFLSDAGLLPETLGLVDNPGAPVSFTQAVDAVAADGAESQWIVTPRKALRGSWPYRLEGERTGGGTFAIDFTTGDAPDEQRPTLGGVDIAAERVPGACDAHLAAEVVFDIDLTDGAGTPADQLLVRVDLSGPDGASWRIYRPYDLAFFGRDETGAEDPCVSGAPDATEEAEYTAAVAAVDWAGNVSKPSAEIPFGFTAYGGTSTGGDSGCRAGTHAAGAVGWPLALGLSLLVSRAWRRRHAPRMITRG